MEQVGLVTKIDGNMAEVEVKRMSACGHSCENCSGSCNVPGVKVHLPNTLNAKEGDYVEIKVKTKSVLKYTILIYMIPFVMLILGIFLGMYIFQSIGIKSYENFSFLLGLVFLTIAYIILKKIDKKVEKDGELTFEMTRKI